MLVKIFSYSTSITKRVNYTGGGKPVRCCSSVGGSGDSQSESETCGVPQAATDAAPTVLVEEDWEAGKVHVKDMKCQACGNSEET